MSLLSALKIAVVHEWLKDFAGSEKVLQQILEIVPHADLFAVCNFLDTNDAEKLGNRKINTTFIQRMPFSRKKFRGYLPIMPFAIEQFDLSQYDLVVSTSHAVAKGVITGPDQLHVSYVHSPIRYAWDFQHQYLREAGIAKGIRSVFARAVLHYIRMWDFAAAARVDHFVANSHYIARRIEKVYRRNADVIHPPVDVASFAGPKVIPAQDRGNYYLAASRLVPYKRMDLIVEAFADMPDKKLIMIGDGPEMSKIKSRSARASNIEILGYQKFENLKEYMRNAKAFVFCAEEDFGITTVEAMAAGTPVIAFGRGGSAETVRDGIVGHLFFEQSVSQIRSALNTFETHGVKYSADQIADYAKRFCPQRFCSEFKLLLETKFSSYVTQKVAFNVGRD